MRRFGFIWGCIERGVVPVGTLRRRSGVNPADREKLSDQLGYLSGRGGSLTIIDEIQRVPGSLLNAAEYARSLGVDGKSVARYLDLLVDLLLLRRLQPLHTNTRKRLVKSPKIYVRDSGLVHSLLRLGTTDDVLGHALAGASWT